MSEGKSFEESMFDQLVERLRQPLSKIRLMNEAGDVAAVDGLVSHSISLLDDLQYLQNIRRQQIELEFEPVNLAALTDDIAHRLFKTVSAKSLELETVTLKKRIVLSHRKTLERAYENMSRAVVDMSAYEDRVVLSASLDRGAVRYGAYGAGLGLNAADFHRLQQLAEKSSRPLGTHTSSAALELIIARQMFDMLGSKMRTAISARSHGFASTLPLSTQLNLVS